MTDSGDHGLSKFLSTKEAAAELGYTLQHTRLLIRQGLLDATKMGRDWWVFSDSVENFKKQRNAEDMNGKR